MNPYAVIFALLYLAGMLYLGYHTYQKVYNLNDYYVAGGHFGTFFLGLGVMASVMSGWMWLGLSGTMYGSGMSIWVMIMGFSWIGLVLTFILVGKPMRTILDRFEVYTLPDVLEARYGNSGFLRVIAAITIAVACVGYLLAQWASMGWVLSVIFSIPYFWAIIISAIVIGFYTVAGGMLASVWTNAVQMMVMLVGSVAVFFASTRAVGGYTELNRQVAEMSESHLQPWLADVPALSMTLVLSYAIGIGLLTYGGVPTVSLKFLAAREHKVLRWSPLVSVVAYSIGGLVAFSGLAGFVLVEQGAISAPEAADQILPHMMTYLFHPAFAGFILAAVLAAVMSTSECFIVIGSSAIIRDLWVKGLGKTLTSAQELKAMRGCIIIFVLASTGLAINPPAFLALVGAVAWSLFSAAFGPALMLGLRWKRATTAGAIASVLTGLIIAGGIQIANEVLGFIEGWHIGGIGAVLSLIAFIVVSLMTKPSENVVFGEVKES